MSYPQTTMLRCDSRTAHEQAAEWASAVTTALASLGVLRDSERVTLLHEWNCDKYVTPGAACDCSPTLAYEGPDESEGAFRRRHTG